MISSCPECSGHVRSSEQLPPDSIVRCPHCEKEFEYHEAGEVAAPEVIVVQKGEPVAVEAESHLAVAAKDDFSADLDALGEAEAAASDGGDELDFLSQDDELGDRAQSARDGEDQAEGEDQQEDDDPDNQEPGAAHDDEDETATVADVASAGESTAAEFAFGDEDAPSDAVGDEAVPGELVETGNQQFEFGEQTNQIVDAAGFDAGDDGIPMAPLQQRRPKKSGSPVRQIVGVFGGGVIGLSLGYFILLWIGGPKKDFLKLGSKLPALLVPAAFHEEKEAQIKPRFLNEIREFDSSNDDWMMKSQSPVKSRPNQNQGKSKSGDSNPAIDAAEKIDVPFPEEPPLDPAGDIKIDEEQVGPRQRPQVEPNTLGAALVAVRDSHDFLISGTLSTSGPQMADAYRAFCQLAHALTFATGGAAEDQLLQRREAARNLAEKVAAGTEGSDDLQFISTQWLKAPFENRMTDGVYLVGTVESVDPSGALEVTTLTVQGPKGAEAVTVLTDRPADWKPGDRIWVLGVQYSQPADNIIGYQGNADRAVWTGAGAKLAGAPF